MNKLAIADNKLELGCNGVHVVLAQGRLLKDGTETALKSRSPAPARSTACLEASGLVRMLVVPWHAAVRSSRRIIDSLYDPARLQSTAPV